MKAFFLARAARTIIAAFLAIAMVPQLTASAQETRPYADPARPFIKGTTTEKTRTLESGTTITTTATKASGTDPKTGAYYTLSKTYITEKDANGKQISYKKSEITTEFGKEGGEQTAVEMSDSKETFNQAGGSTLVSDYSDVDKLTGKKRKYHYEEQYDAGHHKVSGHMTITTTNPGENPLVKEHEWDKKHEYWKPISMGEHAKPTTTGGHYAKHATGSHAAATHGKRTASLYLSGTITSLEGCEGVFYGSFPKVGTTTTDTGAVSTKGGVLEFNGSAMEYDPYAGTLMADGNFHLTSTRSAGTTIEGTIQSDNTVSGMWHKVYDPHCSYTVSLMRGKGTSGSNVSVSGGGSWRLALSGSHQ